MKQQIKDVLGAFAGADLRIASIGLLNTLGYRSGKTLDLDNTPDAFLAEFDKRDRKFRKDKALFECWKSVEFLFQITDDEVRNAGVQGTLFGSGYDHANFRSYLFFALDLAKNHYTRTRLAAITREINLLDSYKFTISENTPIEEEIALDPELLGKVFENLLDSYNPETGATARKQTGSFYTPREIVNYMVDESLIAYLDGKLDPSDQNASALFCRCALAGRDLDS